MPCDNSNFYNEVVIIQTGSDFVKYFFLQNSLQYMNKNDAKISDEI